MRTTLTLDDDVHEFASVYANSKGITLSAAMNEIVRKVNQAPRQTARLHRAPNGFPILPPCGRTITAERVKQLEEDEFDPKAFA